jgi:hypothetical protein
VILDRWHCLCHREAIVPTCHCEERSDETISCQRDSSA